MRRLLVVVDGQKAQRSRAAAEQAAALCTHPGTRVHLLSVQTPVTGHVAMFFGAEELRQLMELGAQEELLPARAALDAAGVRYSITTRVGNRAETIAEVAKDLCCDTILLGGDPSVASRLLGSVAEQVRHLLEAGSRCQVIGS
jgi:nucleotide-binding universal stress UspA family protein